MKRKRPGRLLTRMLCVVVVATLLGCGGDDVEEIYDRMQTEDVTVRRLDEHAESALILQNEGAHRRLLIFVHGWNGNAFATWGDIIPALTRARELPEPLRWLAEFDVLTFGYSTGVGEEQSIEEVARQLKSVIDLEVLGRGYSSVHILAHSMGGLVVQRYLLDELLTRDDVQLRKLQSAIQSVIYFDSPHNGLELADEGTLKWLVRLEKETAAMREDSEFRRRLQEHWNDVLKPEGVPDLAKQLLIDRAWIFEAQHTHEQISVSGSQGIYGRFVDTDLGARSTIRMIPGTDHSSICKSTWEEIAAAEGVFMQHVVPVLGRSEVVNEVADRPFGVSASLDGKWVYVAASRWDSGGYVHRINASTLEVDSWEASVGANPHEFVEVDLGEGAGVVGISTDNDRLNRYTVCPAQKFFPEDECEAGLTFVRMRDGRPVARLALGGEPDSIAVRGHRVAISDGSAAGRVWVVDAGTREVVELSGIGGGDWHLTGITFVDHRRLLVAGHRGLGPSEGLLALLETDPAASPRVLDTVETLPVASDVDYLEELGVAAVSSFRESAGIAFHRLEGDDLTENNLEKTPSRVCFRGARITDLRPVDGGNRLLAACQDGAVRRLTWDEGEREFRADEFFHGGKSSWAATSIGDRVFVSNGDDDSVSVIWASNELWPPAPDCR